MAGSQSKAQGGPPIVPGSVLILLRGPDRVELEIKRFAEGLIWIAADALGGLQSGELVDVEIGVRGDARYRSPARVAIAMRDHIALRLDEHWRRQQTREFARVSTYGLRADLVLEGLWGEGEDDGAMLLDRERPDRLSALSVIDLSAGGARLAEGRHLRLGDRVMCRLVLDECSYDLCAQVVRVGSELGEGTRRFVSLQFMEIDEETRSALVAWVNREQVRRRIELRGRSLSRSRG